MACIEKRGPYQFRVKIKRKGFPPQSKTFEAYDDAVKWAREVESEIDRGVFVSRREAESTTLQEALERFELEYLDNYKTPRKVRSRIRQITNRPISSKHLAAIRGKDLAEHIRLRQDEGAGAQTITHEINLISRIYGIASTDWGMESLHNPAKRVNKPKLPPGRSRRLEVKEEEQLLQAADERLKPVILFALETAMRRSEIAELSWDRVDLKQRFIHLPMTKNGEARSVPLSRSAIEILKSIPRNIQGEVFGLSANWITKLFHRASTGAGLPDLRFHDLRHEAISRLFENTDLDVMEIKTISGHKTLQMLARYSHLRAHRLADRLDGVKRGQKA
ncbi:integrase [Desulfocurvus vexinensis]|uniref:integrase n=1 Tax=Desulfocurvus vexinensis TaxID=399548 RepID=UPI0004906E99|nr:site-specific integrase [Desulfocurvus vexinensis]